MERKDIVTKSLEIIEQDDFIIYEDTNNGEDYNPTQRSYENDIISIRLYCDHEGCNKYIKGLEYYNGGFISENGSHADLRNQSFICPEHK